MQSALRMIYPSECLLCRGLTESDFGLCGACWRDTPFIAGLVCDKCGTPLPGDDTMGDVQCDDCMITARPWARGRSAMAYRDNGRKFVLGLKHGDRSDLAKPSALWMARAAAPLVDEKTVLVPVPLHWTRLFARRYNQSAMLALAVGRQLSVPVFVDALHRHKRTPSLGIKGRDERFATVQGAIVPHAKRGAQIQGKTVILVDDVMTTGATLAACCAAAHSAGAETVHILTLARTGKET